MQDEIIIAMAVESLNGFISVLPTGRRTLKLLCRRLGLFCVSKPCCQIERQAEGSVGMYIPHYAQDIWNPHCCALEALKSVQQGVSVSST